MKVKHLIIVALLLAIITMGAVSAADDVASDDDLAVSDEESIADTSPLEDELGDMSEDDVSIDVVEEIERDDSDSNLTTVSFTEEEGEFVISTDYFELYREDLDGNGRIYQDEGDSYLGVSLSDINSYCMKKYDSDFYGCVSPEDNVTFAFIYRGNTLVMDEYTVYYNDTHITFASNGPPADEDDGVVIESVDGNFDISDNGDGWNETFIKVIVRNDLEGNITITSIGRKFFNMNINAMAGEDSYDYDGFKEYSICLNDLEGVWDFIDNGTNFEVAFNDGDDDIDSRNFISHYDGDNEIITFEADEETEEPEEQGFDFDPIVENTMDLGSEDTVVDIVTPKGGYFTIFVSQDGEETYNITHVINKDDVKKGYIEWTLEDLSITKTGIYFLNAAYTDSDSNTEDVFEDELLIVTEVPMVIVPGQFDANDADANIVSIYCPEDFPGAFIVVIYEPIGNYDEYIAEAKHVISADDYGKYVNFTLRNFTGNFENEKEYRFYVYWLEDETLDADEAYEIVDRRSWTIDFTIFHMDLSDWRNVLFDDEILLVYCPVGSEGNVTVTIRKEGEENVTVSKEINSTNLDENNYMAFTERELHIGSVGEYLIGVYANDEFVDSGRFMGGSPIEIYALSYLNTNDEERIFVVTLEIPSDMEGNVCVTINGTYQLSLALSDFAEGDNDTTVPYWTHPHHWGNVEDTKIYYLTLNNMGYDFKLGTYEISVDLSINDGPQFYGEENITVSKSNNKTVDGITVEIFDDQPFYFDDDYNAIVKITAEDEDGVSFLIIDSETGDELCGDDLDSLGDGRIYASDFELSAGTYNITVIIFKDGKQLFNHSAEITLDYGEDGIMSSDLDPNDIRYSDDWAIVLNFATDEISGEIVIEIDGIEYYRKHIDYYDLDYGSFGIGPCMFDETIELGHYDSLTIYYYGDDGINDMDYYEDITISNPPDVWIPDWPISIRDDDVISINPGDDDSDDFRVILMIGDEVYLNATKNELGLYLKTDDQGNKYYGISADMLNRTLLLGEEYDDVVAYYISDNYESDTYDEENPITWYIVGMIGEEVEYNYTDIVMSVYSEKEFGEILIFIDEEDPLEYDIHGRGFMNFNLEDLNLGVGEYFIEVRYDNDDFIFGGNLLVVNNSDFRVKTHELLEIYGDMEAVSVFCPQETAGKTIAIYTPDWDGFRLLKEYTIMDEDQGNYVGFTLNDLGIDGAGWYQLNVTVDDRQISDEDCGIPVVGIIESNLNDVVAMGDGKDVAMRIADLNLPFDFEGNITVTLDGKVVFNKNLNDVDYQEWGDGIRYNKYTIYTSDLEGVDEGTYNMVVAFEDIADGEKTIRFAPRNVNTSADGNVSIDMFSITTLSGDWSHYFAIIEVPMDYNFDIFGDVKVQIDGEDYNVDLWGEEDNWDKNTKVYFIRNNPNEFRKIGIHNVTVICYDEYGDEIVRNNDTLNLFENPRIFVMWSNYPDEVKYDLDSDDMIHIYPNGDMSNFRIVVMIGDEVYFNATKDEMGVVLKPNDHDELYFTIGPANFTKAINPGYYDNVLAIYSCDYCEVHSDEDGMPTYAELYGNSNITFSNDIEYVYGANGTTTITLVGATVSEQNISVDGVAAEIRLLDGGVITVSGLNIGDYTLRVITTPINEYYRSVEGTANIKVTNEKSSVNASDITFDYGGSNSTTVILGNASDFYYDGNASAGVSRDGNVITVYGLDAGVYNLSITTVPDANHISVSENVTVTVNKVKSSVNASDITFDYGSSNSTNVTIEGALEFTAVLNVTSGKVNISENGINVSGLDAGIYTLFITTVPDANHEAVTENVTVTVNKVDSSVEIPDVNFYYGGSSISVTLVGADTVTASVNDTSGVVSVEGNVITVSGLNVGNYMLFVTTVPDANHEAVTKNTTIVVNKANPTLTVEIADINITSTALEITANLDGDYNITFGNFSANFTVSNGKATVPIAALAANEKITAVVVFKGNATHNEASATADFKVTGEDSKPDVIIPTIEAGKATKVPIKLASDATGTVQVMVDGKVVATATLVNGQAEVEIPAQTAGDHTITIAYSGDGKYSSFTKDSKVTVKPAPKPAVVKKASKIIAKKKKTFKSKTKIKKYVITLKSGKTPIKRVWVFIKIGKKTFKAKTTNKGKATFKIKKLTKKGRYNAVIRFKGNSNYKPSSKKVKITVKK